MGEPQSVIVFVKINDGTDGRVMCYTIIPNCRWLKSKKKKMQIDINTLKTKKKHRIRARSEQFNNAHAVCAQYDVRKFFSPHYIVNCAMYETHKY